MLPTVPRWENSLRRDGINWIDWLKSFIRAEVSGLPVTFRKEHHIDWLDYIRVRRCHAYFVKPVASSKLLRQQGCRRYAGILLLYLPGKQKVPNKTGHMLKRVLG